MTIIHESYFTVSKHFPAHRPLTQGLFRNSPVFRETCKDYHKCNKALHYWSDFSSQEALFRKQEYSILLQELKQELVKWINLFDVDTTISNIQNNGENK